MSGINVVDVLRQRAHELVQNFGRPVRGAIDRFPIVLARKAEVGRRVDDMHFDARFFQRADDADVSEAACGAPAQDEPDVSTSNALFPCCCTAGTMPPAAWSVSAMRDSGSA